MIAAIQMRIAKAQEATGKPAGRKSSRSVAFKTSTRVIQMTSEPWDSRSTQASFVPSNAGERPPTSLDAGKHSKATGMKNGLTVHILRTRPAECDVYLLRATPAWGSLQRWR